MTEPEVKIGHDTLIALAAIAWADGKIASEEAAGMRNAVTQLELTPDEKSAVERALTDRVDLAEVETVRMNRLTRLFTYSVATWMAHLDGGAIKPEERVALDTLGDRLGLSSVARERAQTVATALSRGGLQTEIDLMKLRSRLSVGLSRVGDD